MYNETEKVKNPISIKLLNIIFSIYFCFTIIITATQIFIELKDSKQVIMSELQSVEQSNKRALEQALWVFDDEQVKSIADGVIQLQFVTGLSIKDNNGKLMLSRGEVNDTHFIYHQFKINHGQAIRDQALKKIDLADIVIFSDRSILFERTKTRVISIIISAVIKSIILWLIIFWVLKKYLFKPLCQFVQNIEKVDLNSLNDKTIFFGIKEKNELKVIEKSFNSMLCHLELQKEQLIHHEQQLLDASYQYNEKLEITVAKRTQELVISNEKLKALANTDPLTKLNNRRYFFESGHKLLATAIERKQPLFVIMCDIDFFKKINDEYGHAVGDEALIAFAKTVSSLVREGDVFARMGGEEFALIISNLEFDISVALAERIRLALAAIKIESEGTIIQFTVSFGIASYQTDDENLDDILHKADVNLYRAKETGRNKICF